MRNLGWALTALGGGIMGLPELGWVERFAVYSIVLGTVVSVGSQAIINEMEGRDGDWGAPGGRVILGVYKNRNCRK